MKIGEILEYLFGGHRPPDVGPTYEDRRWFRRYSVNAARPGPGERDEEERVKVFAQDVDAAQDILTKKIAKEIPRWIDSSPRRRGPPPAVTSDGIPPRMPYDVFAAAAHLVEMAGVYHHIQPEKRDVRTIPGVSSSGLASLTIDISQTDRDTVAKAAAAWRSLPFEPASMRDLAKLIAGPAWYDLSPLFESWWIVFVAFANAEVLSEGAAMEQATGQPQWWKHAWRLFAIADEAAKGTGFQHDASDLAAIAKGEKPATQVIWFEYELYVERALIPQAPVAPGGAEPTTGVFMDIGTMSVARRSVLNVLRK